MKLRVVLPVVLFYFLHGWIRATFVPVDFDRKSRALEKIIDYIGERPHQMDADVTLGIAIAEANIAGALLHENSRYLGKIYTDVLKNTLINCERTRLHLKDYIVPNNANTELLQSILSDPKLWLRPISWRNISHTIVQPSTNFTNESIINLTMQGQPKEFESDYCLVQIIRNKLFGECKIPRLCLAMLLKGERARGYPLTHRLLIAQIAKAVGCRTVGGIKSSDLIQQYCDAILRDLVDIDSAGYPFNTRDLAMEQIVLCGIEGYLEFINDHYGDLVLGWAYPSGCYSAFGTPEKIGLVRRTSLPTDFGCDSHSTGLAAAVLSVYIRESLENAFN